MSDVLARVARMAAASAGRETVRASQREAERTANQRDFAELVAFKDSLEPYFPGVKIIHAYNGVRAVGAPFPGTAVKPVLESDLFPDGHPYAQKREAVPSEGAGAGLRAMPPAGAGRDTGKPASPPHRGRRSA